MAADHRERGRASRHGETRRQESASRAAEQFAGSTAESYRLAVERAFAARESSVRLTRDFFEEGLDLMRDHAELGLRTTQRLAELAREQQETFRRLSEESGDAYTGFLDSLYEYGDLQEREDPGR